MEKSDRTDWEEFIQQSYAPPMRAVIKKIERELRDQGVTLQEAWSVFEMYFEDLCACRWWKDLTLDARVIAPILKKQLENRHVLLLRLDFVRGKISDPDLLDEILPGWDQLEDL